MPINGVPQPGRFRALGGKKIRGKHTGGGCLPPMAAVLAAPWILDLVLAGSRVIA